jgi:hypothetical protein
MKYGILLIIIELAVVFGALYELNRRALEDITTTNSVPYTKLSYSQMRQKLADLAQKYPQVMQLSNSEEMFDIKH